MNPLSWWSEKNPRDRLIVGAGILVTFAFFVGALVWLFVPGYTVLLSNLSPADAANVANQLALEKIRFRLDEKKGTLMVDRGDLDLARMYVVERGLPQSRPIGFELFDKSDFGMTDFNQRINYQRALEGELTRTIMVLDEIEHARLHLVIPEVSLFKRQDEIPKASLTLALKPSAQLTQQRIEGIQQMIASAVPGLLPQNVVIHDQMGNPLSADGSASLSGGAISARLEAKRSYETYLARKAQEILDRAFGPGAAAVMVDVEVDHDHKQITRTEVIPVKEGVTGAVTGLRSMRGGRAAKAPEDPAAPPSLTPQDATTEIKYEVGRAEEKIDVTAGAIRRMTVGVLVPIGTSDEDKQRIAETVANSIGLDVQHRGDAIAVQELGEGARPLVQHDAVVPIPPPMIRGQEDWSFSRILLGAVAVLFALIAAYQWGSSRGSLSTADRRKLLGEVNRLLDLADAQSGRNA